MRAWFSGRTRPCQGRDSGSIPGARTIRKVVDYWGSYCVWMCITVDKSVDNVYKGQIIWLITVL